MPPRGRDSMGIPRGLASALASQLSHIPYLRAPGIGTARWEYPSTPDRRLSDSGLWGTAHTPCKVTGTGQGKCSLPWARRHRKAQPGILCKPGHRGTEGRGTSTQDTTTPQSPRSKETILTHRGDTFCGDGGSSSHETRQYPESSNQEVGDREGHEKRKKKPTSSVPTLHSTHQSAAKSLLRADQGPCMVPPNWAKSLQEHCPNTAHPSSSRAPTLFLSAQDAFFHAKLPRAWALSLRPRALPGLSRTWSPGSTGGRRWHAARTPAAACHSPPAGAAPSAAPAPSPKDQREAEAIFTPAPPAWTGSGRRRLCPREWRVSWPYHLRVAESRFLTLNVRTIALGVRKTGC